MNRPILIPRTSFVATSGLLFFGLYGWIIGRTAKQLEIGSLESIPTDELLGYHLAIGPIVLLVSIAAAYALVAIGVGLRSLVATRFGPQYIPKKSPEVKGSAHLLKSKLFLVSALWTFGIRAGFGIGQSSLTLLGNSGIEVRSLFLIIANATILSLVVGIAVTFASGVLGRIFRMIHWPRSR